jgi:hypothetical protein
VLFYVKKFCLRNRLRKIAQPISLLKLPFLPL